MADVPDPLLKLYDHILGTIVPWWEILLILAFFILLLIGRSTDDYVPGSENKLIFCHNGSETLKDVTLCIGQVHWLERNFGSLIIMLASVFGFLNFIWRLHPQARYVLGEWNFVFQQIPQISPNDIIKYNTAFDEPSNPKKPRKYLPEFDVIQKLKTIVTKSHNVGSNLSLITSYYAKSEGTGIIAFVLLICVCFVHSSFTCVLSDYTPQVFHCTLKSYESYWTNSCFCFCVFYFSYEIMSIADKHLEQWKFGSPKYMLEMLSKQGMSDADRNKALQFLAED